MGYKRRQKDLERKAKNRNPFAKSLSNAKYRQRVVQNKKLKLNKKKFQIIKLRTMQTNSEKNGAVWSKKNDSRITKVGFFLRLTRVDELPQLINVLNNKMSLIGPRPERPFFVEDLSKKIPNYYLRSQLKNELIHRHLLLLRKRYHISFL